MENVNLLFFNVPEKLPVIGQLQAYYKEKSDYEVHHVEDGMEAAQIIAAEENGVVVFKVENKDDLQIAVNFLKSNRKLIKKGLIKPACLSYFKSKKVEKILQKYGCIDLLEPENLKVKTFSFKIDFWSKNIRAQIKKAERERGFNQKDARTAKSDAKQEEPKEGFASAPGLELQSDIWISKDKNDHKKILRRFLCRFAGPSPHAGKWVELQKRPGDRQSSWKFALEDPEAQFIMDDGAWYFSGSKPEFDWKINKWVFSAERPHLYFYTENKEVYSKVKFKEGRVFVAENSTYALTKEEAIAETCDKKYAFENDREEADEGQNAGGEVDEISGHMRGDGSEADRHDGNWDGESSTDDLGEGKIKGSLEYDLDGPGEERRTKNKADEYEGHYSGKGKTDELERDPLAGDLMPERKKNKERENGGFGEDDLGGHMGGKSRTDELERDPLAGDLKPQKKKNKDKDREGFDEDELGGHMGGKSRTDELERDPLAGDLKPQKRKNKDSATKDSATKDRTEEESSKEKQMREALDGGLADGTSENPDKAGLRDKIIEKSGDDSAPRKPADKNAMIGEAGGGETLNTESGQLRVVLTYERDGGNIDLICGFEDFFPDELVVTVPKAGLEMNKRVKATVRLDYGGEKKVIKASGEVFEVDDFEPEEDAVTIALEGVDETEYESFMNLYQDRQGNISEFMRLAKGYE